MPHLKNHSFPSIVQDTITMVRSKVDKDARFRKLVENSHDGITLLNKNLQIIYRSRSAERINGWTTNDRAKYSINDLIHPTDIVQVKQVLNEVLSTDGLSETCRFHSKHFDGHYILLEATFTNFLHDADIDAIVCNFTDISKKKHAEDLLQQANMELFAYKYALDESAIVAITDQKGIIRHVNDNFCKISKYTREELIGQDHRIINSGYHEKAFIRNLWVTIGNGKIWKGELKNKAKDGSFYWVDTTIAPFLDENGKPYQYAAIRSDITERKLNEEKIIESESFIKTITDNLPAMIAYWNADLNCLFANKPYMDWFEKQPQEMLGINKRDLLDNEEFERDELHILNVLNGTPQRFERIFHKPDSTTIYTDTQYLPDKQGDHIKGFYSLIYDVTEIELAEVEIKRKTELLNKVIELARIGAWEVDLERRMIHWANMTREIYEVEAGFEISIEQGTRFYKEGKDRETIIKTMEEAILKGISADVELQIVTAKGNIKWVRVIVESEFTNGKCSRLYGSFQDIDARKKAEIAGKKALEERNTILESIDDAFFAVDKNWVVTYWNNTAEKVFGTPKEKILDHNLWEVFSDSIDSESYKKYHEAIETNQVLHFEDYYLALNKWYEISAYPADNGLSVYFKDITERKTSEIQFKELNEALQKRAKELAISNAELEQFAYVASHDLQEPLRMVTSFLTQLEKKYGDIVDDKGRQYIHFAVDGAKRMRQIILDLLDFSRVGRMEDDLEEMNFNKLINEILALYRKQIEELNASIVFENLPAVETYKTPLRQVLQYLISNSLKYHQAGLPPIINISCKETKIQYQFSVRDNGIGIDSEYFDKIFIIFQRLHNKNEYSGTGMGLAIAKKIIENMGGKIWVESVKGNGSTFHFTLLKNNKS